MLDVFIDELSIKKADVSLAKWMLYDAYWGSKKNVAKGPAVAIVMPAMDYSLPNFGENMEAIDVKEALRSLANGLAHIHDNDMVHADVKFDNTLYKQRTVEEGGDLLQVADFGTLQTVGSKYQRRAGTPGYMAPEIENNQMFDQKADVWSFGVIVYQLQTGEQMNGNHVLQKAKNGSLKRKHLVSADDSYDAGWKDLCLSCLSVDPRDRPTMLEILDHPWIQSNERALATPAHMAGLIILCTYHRMLEVVQVAQKLGIPMSTVAASTPIEVTLVAQAGGPGKNVKTVVPVYKWLKAANVHTVGDLAPYLASLPVGLQNYVQRAF
mmetsp:Transcript_40577/g.102146  ORF Transcript_40577/g.102146 Transcript_40577/m.102146 type:complete len:324 (+) Transcript_40577:403-1374(+)|eukprot:CAMPEP_0177661504 /NCGR_PEP_ID=MMETSP0447-20121125/18729_1 /TAXON_ID=0 /ORGANISM="Stygamoeba regulata, Strain BSH-02190019" /LENGTH=323 /DNA_ID=CAMNT_0019166881 /DNA_START=525 /DNA_END=1496 /DNA_ORIENTATION=-